MKNINIISRIDAVTTFEINRPKVGTKHICLIDTEDEYLLEEYSFVYNNEYVVAYSHREGNLQKYVKLHRLITSAPDEMQVDHVNGDKSDNRKVNLRICTQSENRRNRGKQRNNTSGFKGVFWYKANRKWRAIIALNGKHKHLGYFDTPEEAAEIYNQAALELFGEFAQLNIIESYPLAGD